MCTCGSGCWSSVTQPTNMQPHTSASNTTQPPPHDKPHIKTSSGVYLAAIHHQISPRGVAWATPTDTLAWICNIQAWICNIHVWWESGGSTHRSIYCQLRHDAQGLTNLGEENHSDSQVSKHLQVIHISVEM